MKHYLLRLKTHVLDVTQKIFFKWRKSFGYINRGATVDAYC